jgi:hypothetical protein
MYEDHVLGKLYADWTFERACDALRRYEKRRDRARGLAFLISQFRRRADFDGVLLPPSLIRSFLDQAPEVLLHRGREYVAQGLMPLLETCYQSLAEAARRTPEILALENVRALENGVALVDEGQRVAHDEIERAKLGFLRRLPPHRIKPLSGRKEVPTRVLDEDTYPVGGYTSISTRGTIESLLHSQLAYIEPEARPDLFDVKFLRDELYYYSRDENQFLRRRRAFAFGLYPDLVETRFKDQELPHQRIVLTLGLLCAAAQKLMEWLSTDALKFDFLFLSNGSTYPLAHEQELVKLLFQEQIENGTVNFSMISNEAEAMAHCSKLAQRHLCHYLTVSTRDRPQAIPDVVVTRLQIDGPFPSIAHEDDMIPQYFDDWDEAIKHLLELWV